MRLDMNMTQRDENKKFTYYRYLWWIWQFFLGGAGLFFMWFGFMVLAFAYQLNDPYSFIMTFFSASLIILISAVAVIAFVYRLLYGKPGKNISGE